MAAGEDDLMPLLEGLKQELPKLLPSEPTRMPMRGLPIYGLAVGTLTATCLVTLPTTLETLLTDRCSPLHAPDESFSAGAVALEGGLSYDGARATYRQSPIG